MLTEHLKIPIKSISNFHIQGQKPNIFLFSTPRSGSTWLMELIASQKGMKVCNEPFNIRKPYVQDILGIHEWETLCNSEALKKVEHYLRLFISGSKKVATFDLLPYQPYHRFFTNRIVFKLLFFGEHRITWLRNTFDAQMIFSIRHPIPVSVSRENFTRLNSYVHSEYSQNFSQAQLTFATAIMKDGSAMEKGVLDWCFQNAPLLRYGGNDLLLVTYEQLTLQPELIIDRMAEHLDLDDKKSMLNNVTRPSKSVSKSNQETTSFLKDTSNYEANKKWLIEKWKKKVLPDEEEKLMNILKVFELDIYTYGDVLPNKKYWINHNDLVKI